MSGLALAICSLLAVLAQGQEAPPPAPQSTGSTDELFLIVAAQGDLYEIDASRLAQQQASSEGILSLVQTLIDDNSQSRDLLLTMVEGMGVSLDMPPGPAQQLMISHLDNLQGKAFDRAYLMQQQLAHELAVSLYQIEAESGQHEGLRAFAQETLPVLEQHLQLVQDLMQGQRRPLKGR